MPTKQVQLYSFLFIFNKANSTLCTYEAAFFEYLPMKKTINARGAKTVWVKCAGSSKERATVMLLGDSNGVKYTPFVVYKMKPSKNKDTAKANDEKRCGFGVRTWPEIKRIKEETGLQDYTNEKGGLMQ
jgi:hypothetical protein